MEFKIKKTALNVSIIMAMCMTAWISLEVVLYFYYNGASPSAIVKENSPEYLTEWFNDKSNCPFGSTLIKHPVLGYVHRPKDLMSSNCSDSTITVNNIGLNSKNDLPLEKNKKEFRIFILGESLSQQIANYDDIKSTEDSRNLYFESYLNKYFISPNGYPFVVSTGSMHGWAFPNQLLITMMYSERIDAVISIDGYNEAKLINKGRRLETIWSEYSVIASYSKSDFFHHYSYAMKKLFKLNALPFFEKSYGIAILFNLGSLMFKKIYINDQVVREFTEGASEPLDHLHKNSEIFVLDLYERYIKNFHTFAKKNNLYSIQFLQPSAHINKALTTDEKLILSKDPFELETFSKIQLLFFKLRDEKFPVYDLTNIFKDEKSSLYKTATTFQDENGFSLGSEMIIHALAKELQTEWNLKAKKN